MNSAHINRIKEVYPDLSIEDVARNEIGQNNDVLVINHSLVFRFPKYRQGIAQLEKETKILELIRRNVSIPVPEPVFSSFEEPVPGNVFAGYFLIEGVPFWKASLANIQDAQSKERLASQLAGFLADLHFIAADGVSGVLGQEEKSPRKEMADLFGKIQGELFPYIREDKQEEITQSFRTFLESAASNVKPVLIHGDFGASNILWNPDKQEISGVIDFGGSGLGDPAYDFAGILSSYGEDFFALCLSRYPAGEAIAERVRFYKSTFALQEALHGLEHGDRQAFENGIKGYR